MSRLRRNRKAHRFKPFGLWPGLVFALTWACGDEEGGGGSGDQGCNPPCSQGQVCGTSARGQPICVASDGDPQPTPMPPPGALGASCRSNEECTSQICVGTETTLVCSQACSQAPCPNGFDCVNFGDPNIFCMARCSDNSTCSGFVCQDLEDGLPVCLPPGGFGSLCTRREECQSNICVTIDGRGFCSESCGPGTTCPNNAACSEDEEVCYIVCDEANPCPSGLQCQAQGATIGRCIP